MAVPVTVIVFVAATPAASSSRATAYSSPLGFAFLNPSHMCASCEP
ncbi:hypothetical protein OV079_00110 [Nannocystis pusilla]|uniref:Uncharacterized protein n=1 Tax=Nannocystis pusilla TaxID=889268 RepID=A0A9X3EHV3_9BACT|nr:hypothetical protein [Nannocystis pusilla]MCY1003995.1 hypothetical protein [Nannocystis pusilla]